MTTPTILFENELLQVQDLSEQLPRHRNWPWNHSRSARYRLVPYRKVTEAVWHHTARGVPRGIAGPRATAGFCVADPDSENGRHGGHQGLYEDPQEGEARRGGASGGST